jgi:hypothetical protein
MHIEYFVLFFLSFLIMYHIYHILFRNSIIEGNEQKCSSSFLGKALCKRVIQQNCNNYIDHVNYQNTICKLNSGASGSNHICNKKTSIVSLPNFCNIPDDDVLSYCSSPNKKNNIKLDFKSNIELDQLKTISTNVNFLSSQMPTIYKPSSIGDITNLTNDELCQKLYPKIFPSPK